MEAMDFGLWILVIATFGFGYIQGMYVLILFFGLVFLSGYVRRS